MPNEKGFLFRAKVCRRTLGIFQKEIAHCSLIRFLAAVAGATV